MSETTCIGCGKKRGTISELCPDCYAKVKGGALRTFKFDPAEQYGGFRWIMPGGFTDKVADEMRAYLQAEEVDRWIPKKYHDRVSWVIFPPKPDEAGIFRYGSVAWKTAPVKNNKSLAKLRDKVEGKKE